MNLPPIVHTKVQEAIKTAKPMANPNGVPSSPTKENPLNPDNFQLPPQSVNDRINEIIDQNPLENPENPSNLPDIMDLTEFGLDYKSFEILTVAALPLTYYCEVNKYWKPLIAYGVLSPFSAFILSRALFTGDKPINFFKSDIIGQANTAMNFLMTSINNYGTRWYSVTVLLCGIAVGVLYYFDRNAVYLKITSGIILTLPWAIAAVQLFAKEHSVLLVAISGVVLTCTLVGIGYYLKTLPDDLLAEIGLAGLIITGVATVAVYFLNINVLEEVQKVLDVVPGVGDIFWVATHFGEDVEVTAVGVRPGGPDTGITMSVDTSKVNPTGHAPSKHTFLQDATAKGDKDVFTNIKDTFDDFFGQF
jgi:hypothetical protein